MLENNLHFKLYKHGKQWLCMAIATVAALGFCFTSGAKADDSVTNTVNQGISTEMKVAPAASNSSTRNSSLTSNFQSGNQSSSTSTPENGWNSQHTEYYQNGQLANGYREADGQYYMFKNGVRQSGVQKWMGTYYYFDPTTYLRVDNDYREQVWDNGVHDWYMFGNNGQIVTGKYNWQGSVYYFDPSSYLKVINDYRSTEWDGRGVLLGSDGRAQIGVQKWMGTYYYFDPNTKLRVDNDYREQVWSNGVHDWYMFGKNGMIVQGFCNWQGTLYWFDPSSYLVLKNSFFNGSGYWGDWDDHFADANGAVHSVTYFSQFTPIFAPEGCAAASLAMLFSVKGIRPNLGYLYSTLPQYGGVFSSANFRGIIPIDSFAAYAYRLDNNIRNLKGASLGELSNIVLSGHPVLYYGWSSYETVFTGRNHAKLIIGAHNGYYHVLDPCYYSRWQGAYTMGHNRYDHGADTWQSWGSIASEYAGSALTIL